ncbi:MAG: hypothetical protein C5B47_02170 [Verrucomicrobia bacterium]|nr:MAG: hypothetical protein C5B47_02170 [Verrucomicrobiota bacterium]
MFAAFHIPQFHLQAAQRWREFSTVAVIDPRNSVILEASPAAQIHGVDSGITAAQGIARCPELHILQRCPSQERACFALLVETAFKFSSRIEATSSETVILDLTHAPKNICWQKLGTEMVNSLHKEGISTVVGFAPSADHALLAAQSASPVNTVYNGRLFCADLPLTLLAPAPETLSILNDWGIHTIGQLLRLPKKEVIARLGTQAEQMWNKALGRRKRILQLIRPLESFLEAIDFESVVETIEPILFLLHRFLGSLCTRIRNHYRVVREMRFGLRFSDGSSYQRKFLVPAPTTELDTLYRMIHTHIQALQLQQNPMSMQLELFATLPFNRQLTLFEKNLRDPNSFGETLARLKALLGENKVGTPRVANSHRPDAFTLIEFEYQAPSLSPSLQFGLPLRRLRPSIPVNIRSYHLKPAWIDAPHWSGPIDQVSGPYRFSGEWWGETSWAIEEWDAQIEGRGLVRLGRRGERWTLEGIYYLFHDKPLR